MKMKITRTFTIDKDTYEEFVKYCDKNLIPYARKINDLIEKFINEEAKNDNT